MTVNGAHLGEFRCRANGTPPAEDWKLGRPGEFYQEENEMQTHQIIIEFAEDRDRFAMAVIDPEWDADTIHANTKVASTRTKIAMCGDTVVGYIIFRFEARRLAIVRLIAEYDDVTVELLDTAKAAMKKANQKRLIHKLKYIAINVDMDDLPRNELLRANGFRAGGWEREHAEVVMTWDRK